MNLLKSPWRGDSNKYPKHIRGNSNKYPKRMFSQRITWDCQRKKNTRGDSNKYPKHIRGNSNKYPKRMFSQRITWDCQRKKNTRSADFRADRIDVITNIAVITNAGIKRVHFIAMFEDFVCLYK